MALIAPIQSSRCSLFSKQFPILSRTLLISYVVLSALAIVITSLILNDYAKGRLPPSNIIFMKGMGEHILAVIIAGGAFASSVTIAGMYLYNRWKA